MSPDSASNPVEHLHSTLGISETIEAPKEAPSFTLLDFLGFYLFQQFFTILSFSVLSACIPMPSEIDMLAHVWGEQAGAGILYLTSSSIQKTMLLGSTLVGNLAAICLYLLRGRGAYRMSWKAMGWTKAPGRESIRWVVLFYPLVFSFTFGYNALLKALHFAQPSQQVATFLSPDKPLLMRIFAILLVLLAAPILEEILYRGVLFSALRKHISMHNAAWVSGAIFGLAHMEPMTAIPLGFLGYLLAVAYAQSRSLWLPIGLHAINNLLAFVFLLILSAT